MSSSRIWVPIAAALAVVCAAVLAVLAKYPLFGIAVGIVGIASISVVYSAVLSAERAKRAGRRASTGPGDVASLTKAMEQLAKGEMPDLSTIPEESAGPLSRVADRIEEFKREAQELKARDEVTSLANEWVFDNVLWREFNRADRYGAPMSVVILEIVGLSELKSAKGEEAANGILKNIASLVLQMIRETDFAARYDYDRIIVIMPATDKQGANEFVERFRTAIREDTANLWEALEKVSISIGSASVPEEGTKTAPQLVQKAAEALDMVKGAGGSDSQG